MPAGLYPRHQEQQLLCHLHWHRNHGYRSLTTSDDDEDDDEARGSNTATFEAEVPTESDAAGILFVNAGGALAAVAGAIAALL